MSKQQIIEKTIEEYVKAGIQACINDIVNEEVSRSMKILEKRLREEAGRIAIELATLFDVLKDEHRIIITFEDKAIRKAKKK